MTNIIKNIPILEGLTREELIYKVAYLEGTLEAEYFLYNFASENNNKDRIQYHGENIDEIEKEIAFYSFAINCIEKEVSQK